jgi:hypothetical protein
VAHLTVFVIAYLSVTGCFRLAAQQQGLLANALVADKGRRDPVLGAFAGGGGQQLL